MICYHLERAEIKDKAKKVRVTWGKADRAGDRKERDGAEKHFNMHEL